LRHEEFARRAEELLEGAADRLENEARGLGMDGEATKTKAGAGELRVASLLVREEAEAVGARRQGPPTRWPRTRHWRLRARGSVGAPNSTGSGERDALALKDGTAVRVPTVSPGE